MTLYARMFYIMLSLIEQLFGRPLWQLCWLRALNQLLRSPGRTTPEDASEFYHYEDNGCVVSDSCLDCPLPDVQVR